MDIDLAPLPRGDDGPGGQDPPGARLEPAPTLPPRPEPSSIRDRLRAFADAHPELKFSGDAGRDLAHDIVQYPAMMVPKMQGGLIDCFRPHGGPLSIIDPFMGSGTVLVEAQRRGLDFTGVDINPYAYLIATVKATHLGAARLDSIHDRVSAALKADRDDTLDHDFPGRAKWFRDDVARELCRLRRCIRGVSDLGLRRLLWVCLGETVRRSSNSRTSTFKLHIRSPEDQRRPVNATDTFLHVLAHVAQLLKGEADRLGGARPSTKLHLHDIREFHSRAKADLLVSSPPYGDNGTTVPYGQFSYLELQWIDRLDIHPSADEAVKSTHALDTQSLGGGTKHALRLAGELRERSPSLGVFLDSLTGARADEGRRRVLAFYRDLSAALSRCAAMVKPGGHMVWTVGNRRVLKAEVPMDIIMRELLAAEGCSDIIQLKRVIPSKRMAGKNSVSDTMKSETVVVVRNG
jgi:site-specific DNA-methyltransferase (cytosine-N4-specific)